MTLLQARQSQARDMSGAKVHLGVVGCTKFTATPYGAANPVGVTPQRGLETRRGMGFATPRTTFMRTHVGDFSGKVSPAKAKRQENVYTLRPGAPLLQGVPL